MSLYVTVMTGSWLNSINPVPELVVYQQLSQHDNLPTNMCYIITQLTEDISGYKRRDQTLPFAVLAKATKAS